MTIKSGTSTNIESGTHQDINLHPLFVVWNLLITIGIQLN